MDRRIFELTSRLNLRRAPLSRATSDCLHIFLPAHKSAAAEQAVRAMGAWLLFLPPYSPLTSIRSRWASHS